MTGTLFAHEARTTRKTLLGTLAILLIVAALGAGLGALEIPILGPLGYIIALVAAAAVTPAALAILIENYWRTMYGREGYFTMTLPVRGRSIFTAKVLYGLVISLTSLVISALCLIGIAAVTSARAGQPPMSLVQGLIDQAGTPLIATVVVLMVVQLAFSVIAGAAIISIGAQGRFNHLGFMAPVIGYIILYFIMQVLGLAAMLFVPLGIVISGPDTGSIVAHGMLADFIVSIENVSGSIKSSTLGLGIIPLSLVVAAVLAWWGGRTVERHTSLR